MSSGRLVALEQQLGNLRSYFIIEKDDYAAYTAEDHAKAVAFRLQASACIEDYVEQRCLEIARTGKDRLERSLPTATGRALIVSLIVRKSSRAVPIHDNDVLLNVDLADRALESYEAQVKKSHGIAGRDLRTLVFPLGLRDSHVPDALIEGLDQLSKARDPASHAYVNRAKTMTEPKAEWEAVAQLLIHLRQLDTDLEHVVATYPL